MSAQGLAEKGDLLLQACQSKLTALANYLLLPFKKSGDPELFDLSIERGEADVQKSRCFLTILSYLF